MTTDKYIGLAAIGLLIIGSYFIATNSEPAPELSAVKVTNPEIEGSEAVGLVFEDAKSATAMLAQFEVREVPCDPNATTSDCVERKVFYKDQPVKVYATAPLAITEEFMAAVGDFPFAGILEYKDIGEASVDARIVNLMQQAGNKTFDIIYETKR